MKWRKTLVYGLLLSFSLALYQIVFQPWWDEWLKSIGRSIGIAEVAAGYFITWVITLFIGRMVTRKME